MNPDPAGANGPASTGASLKGISPERCLSIAAHEMRTPLASIGGALRLLLEGVAGGVGDEAMELVEVAYAETERLSRMVDNLLDLSRIEEGRLEMTAGEIDLAETVERALKPLARLSTEQEVELKADLRHERVRASSDAVIQVVMNLVSNALKFSPRGASLEVAAGSTEGGEAVVSVSDHGPGIPPEFQPRIFTPFAQGANARGLRGTGLGLSISRALVERMGGRIWYETHPGAGTTFRFTLPRAA